MSGVGPGNGDFKPTEEELQSIQKAMKDEKFRKLFNDYAKEISDPVNKKKYEDDLRKMESQAGNDVKFINPEPGFVVKTTLKNKVEGKPSKVFVNICESEMVDKPTSSTLKQKGKVGTNWSLPHSLTTHRDDVDKAGKLCIVYDCVFHPQALRLASADKGFKKMIVESALEGIEQRFPIHKLEKADLKFPNITFKGMAQRSIIREKKNAKKTEPSASGATELKKLMEEFQELSANDDTSTTTTSQGGDAKGPDGNKDVAKFTVPKHSIVHRGVIDMLDYRNAPDSSAPTRPKELVVSIELPKCSSAAKVELDIAEQSLNLHCDDPGPYKLEIRLPYPVEQDGGSAKFDKGRRTLIVTLPVVAPPPPSEPQPTVQNTPSLVSDLTSKMEDGVTTTSATTGGDTAKTTAPVSSDSDSDGVVVVGKTTSLPSNDPPSSSPTTTPTPTTTTSPPPTTITPTPTTPTPTQTPTPTSTSTTPASTTETTTEGGDDWVVVDDVDAEFETVVKPDVAEIHGGLKSMVDTLTFHQTDAVVSAQLRNSLEVATAKLEFEEHVFGPLKKHTCTAHFFSQQGESLPLGQLLFGFDVELVPDECSIEVSAEVVVILFKKAMVTELHRMMVGIDSKKLVERKFLTTANVGSMAQTNELWDKDGKAVAANVVKKSSSSIDIDVSQPNQSKSTSTSPSPSTSKQQPSQPKAPSTTASSRSTLQQGMKNMFKYNPPADTEEPKIQELESEDEVEEEAQEEEGPTTIGVEDDNDIGYGPLSDARINMYKDATQPLFIESATFTGRKDGYFFAMGDDGLGYYLDPVQQQGYQKPSLTDQGHQDDKDQEQDEVDNDDDGFAQQSYGKNLENGTALSSLLSMELE